MEQPITKLPRIKAFDHIAIEVNDLASAIDFYTDILGLVPLTMPDEITGQGIRWFKMGEEHALHLVESRGTQPGKTAHIAFEVADVQVWKDHLTAHHIATYPPKLDLYQAERIFIFDPSGNRIELVRWL